MNRRDLVKLASAGGVTMAASGPAHGRAGAQPAGQLVIGTAAAPMGYDPALVTAASSVDLLWVVYERLVSLDGEGQAQPELAESWDSQDPLNYTFTLRPNVTFHDGTPLTADDVRFTFDRIRDPATASPWATQFEPVEAIEVVDAHTVTFTFREPYGPFLATLASAHASILPATGQMGDSAMQSPTRPIDFTRTMVGTNAFALDRVTADVETVLVRNDDYWQEDKPQLDRVTYRILPEESDRLAAIRAGEIGLTALNEPASVDAARASDGLVLIEQDTSDCYLLGFNCGRAPFDTMPVRQALSRAIDRQAIVDSVFNGKGHVTGPLAPTLGDWAQPIEQLPNYEVDREGAKGLLAEAGQEGLTFTILVGERYPEPVTLAFAISDQLAEIGVTARVEQVAWDTFIDRWKARDFDAFVSFNASGNDPDRALYAAFHSGGSVNAFQYANEEVDKLLETGRTTGDREARKGTYQQLEVELANEAPAIFICTRVAHVATRDTVTGFMPTATQTWDTLKDTSVS